MIFIFYERLKPGNIDALARLKKRLPDKHPKYEQVCQDLYNYNAGFGGEERVDQVLRKIAFPETYAILPNLYVHDSKIASSQIDVLVATDSYFLILGVKNWTGTLDFKDSPRQVVQTTPTYIKSHDCPCVQAENSVDRLSLWLTSRDINIPVHHAVIFPYASTIINTSQNTTNVHVASELPLVIKKLNTLPSLLTKDLFQQTISMLWSNNTPFPIHPLCLKYSIPISDLQKGLFCPQCHFKLIKRSNRSYYCPSCMSMPSNPFSDAMTDWFHLIGPSISNRELRWFTNSATSHSIGYFMKMSGYARTGSTRDCVYRSEHTAKQNGLFK